MRDEATEEKATQAGAPREKAPRGRVAKEKKAAQPTYAQVVERLECLVQAMEAGELPLEEALETFAEGVHLIKQGERMLSEAEQRVEQLLASGEQTPLHLEASKPAHPGPVYNPSPGEDDDDT
jgi:exodeoxyribonuclease VII small subunit